MNIVSKHHWENKIGITTDYKHLQIFNNESDKILLY